MSTQHDPFFEPAYIISKLSELTGVPQTTIRHWEKSLDEAFPVQRDAAGNRFYTERHVELVKDIQRWRDEEDLPLPVIKKLLLVMQEKEREWEKHDPISAVTGSGRPMPVMPTPIQVSHVMQTMENLQEKMAGFLGQLNNTLAIHNEQQQEFIKNQFDRLHDTLSNSVQKEQLERLEEALHTSTSSSNDLIRSGLEVIREGLVSDQVKHQEELQLKLESTIQNWAVISKDDLSKINEKKKGFLSKLLGK